MYWTAVIEVYLGNGRQGTLDVGAANQVGWMLQLAPKLVYVRFEHIVDGIVDTFFC